METKTCIKCGADLPVEEFSLHHCNKTGKVSRRNVCRACETAQHRARKLARQDLVVTQMDLPFDGDGNPENFQPEISDLVTAYLNLIHWKPENLRTIPLWKYNKHYNLQVEGGDFVEIEDKAEQLLMEFGYFNPQWEWLDAKGKYLVIGDTFGTHTPECVFQLIAQIVKRENINAVIILGHNLDDENLVSNLIASSGVQTIIVAMKDELKDLHAQRGYGYTIVQDHVGIGNIVLRNQEHITPYVKTALGSLDPMLFPGQVIVNCTRQELSVRPTPKGVTKHFVASPGALADPHVRTTINRLIFNSGEGLSVKPTLKDSYLKHRKNETDKCLWERGFIIINKGNFVQRRIFIDRSVGLANSGTLPKALAVSNGVIIDNTGAEYETKQTLVLSDLHLPSLVEDPVIAGLKKSHTNADVVSSGKESVCTQLMTILSQHRPDEIIFNGDIFDCRSFNPHSEYESTHADFAEELERSEKILDNLFNINKEGFNWTITRYLEKIKNKDQIKFLWGNHEDFIRRFTNQYPQFKEYFNQVFVKMLQTYGSVLSLDNNDWYEAGAHVVVHHGSADIFGIGGSNLEKTARTFQRPAIIGHTHSPAIRFGVYRTGCLCKLDQGYNNAQMSDWARGFALIYTSGDMDFIELRNWL